MKITLKAIYLQNFKAIQNWHFDFSQKTRIGGRNGSGKTTIFDAFCWVLFGKSSSDKKDFSVATLDSDGNIIPDLEHKVRAILDVDGKEVEICRTQIEKYKKDGTFKGSEQSRFVNGVSKNVSEYDVFIASLIDANLFKAVTSPYFFTAQNWKVQREFLLQLVDLNKIQMSDEYKALTEKLAGVSIEEYRKKLLAEVKRVDTEISNKKAVLKDRKSEADNSIATDKKTLSEAILSKNNSIKEIDAKILDIARQKQERYKEKESVILDLQKQVSNLRIELNKTNTKAVYEKIEAKQKATYKCEELVKKIETAKENVKENEKILAQIEVVRENLRNDYKNEQKKTLEIDESQFVCPTCKRPLELEDIEAKRAELIANFNSNKANVLSTIRQHGLDKKSEAEAYAQKIQTIKEDIEKFEKDLMEAQSDPILEDDIQEPEPPQDTDEIKALEAKIKELTEELTSKEDNDTLIDDLQVEKTNFTAELADLNKQLGEAEAVEKNLEKIKALECEIKDLQTESVRIEGEIDTIKEYQKEYFGQIESLVNSKFNLAKFKLFDTLISGEQVEACEATYNGVPFADLNNAMKINVGLDIINAICLSKGISAPIFIDNAESVNELEETDSQIIALYVTNGQLQTF